MSKIVVIKYPAGNIQSVLYALERLGETAEWTDDPVKIRNAERVIFPGVGEASTAMQHLRQEGLDEIIRNLHRPVLGICLGLQLFCRQSAENQTTCMGVFHTDVLQFDSKSTGLKVPHMGWNTLHQVKGPLFKGVKEGSYAYFVHSYYAAMDPAAIATTGYGLDFASALHRNNFYAVQFHPEKSGETGQRILHNFLNIK